MATASSLAAGNKHILAIDDAADADRIRQKSKSQNSIPPHPSLIEILFVGKRPTIRHLLSSLPDDPLFDTLEHAIASIAIDDNRRINLTIVSNQKDALIQVNSRSLHAILVELEYHPRSRVQFCRSLRTREPSVEIIAVGAIHPDVGFHYDGETSLPLTVDSVTEIAKRFDVESKTGVLTQGPFRLNTITRVVDTPTGAYKLTPKLAALLGVLLSRHDEVINRGELMETVWETDYLDDTRTLDVHVRWLRQCIEADPSAPRHLLTVRGEGYRLIIDEPAIEVI